MTEAIVPHLFIDFATIDHVMHATGCHCGKCDRDGNSYGIWSSPEFGGPERRHDGSSEEGYSRS